MLSPLGEEGPPGPKVTIMHAIKELFNDACTNLSLHAHACKSTVN